MPAHRPPHTVAGRLRVRFDAPQPVDRAREISADSSSPAQPVATLSAGEAITDDLRRLLPFFSELASGRNVTVHESQVRLPPQQPDNQPLVAQRAGQTERLVEILPAVLATIGGHHPAGRERTGKQRRVADFASHRHGLFGPRRAVHPDRPGVQQGAVGEGTSANRGCCCGAFILAQRRIEPRHQRLAYPPADQPQRHQRRRQPQGAVAVTLVHAPGENRTQIIDLDSHPVDLLLIGRPVFQRRRDFQIVVTVTRSYVVTFARLTELLQRVLAHRLQHPVSRCTTRAFGNYQRLVHQQGELVEHLVTLDLATPATARTAARSKPPTNAASRRNSTRSDSVNNACDQSTEARSVC